jgi:hypothetical protein
MKKQKSRENFWLVLGFQVLWVCVLFGIGLVLAIVDTVSIVVSSLQ